MPFCRRHSTGGTRGRQHSASVTDRQGSRSPVNSIACVCRCCMGRLAAVDLRVPPVEWRRQRHLESARGAHFRSVPKTLRRDCNHGILHRRRCFVALLEYLRLWPRPMISMRRAFAEGISTTRFARWEFRWEIHAGEGLITHTATFACRASSCGVNCAEQERDLHGGKVSAERDAIHLRRSASLCRRVKSAAQAGQGRAGGPCDSQRAARGEGSEANTRHWSSSPTRTWLVKRFGSRSSL